MLLFGISRQGVSVLSGLIVICLMPFVLLSCVMLFVCCRELGEQVDCSCVDAPLVVLCIATVSMLVLLILSAVLGMLMSKSSVLSEKEANLESGGPSLSTIAKKDQPTEPDRKRYRGHQGWLVQVVLRQSLNYLGRRQYVQIRYEFQKRKEILDASSQYGASYNKVSLE